MADQWAPSPDHTRVDTALPTWSTPMTERKMFAACAFYERIAAPGGGWYYDPIMINGPHGDGNMHTLYPPLPGDLIFLWDFIKKSGGAFVVIARHWHHSAYGSYNWPLLDNVAKCGPSVDIIVERVEGDGVFQDRVLRPEDSEDANG